MNPLTLQQIETMCNRAMMRAEAKEKLGRFTLYLADGYSSKPEWTFQRFGVERGEFPFGCFGTLAFIAEGDLVKCGVPLFFDAMHDAGEGWTPDMKKRARLNTARKKARETLDDWLKGRERGAI